MSSDPPEAAERQAVLPLEPFFDLVFVFAFTQVSTLLVRDPTWGGVLRAGLLLSMLWWAWSAYFWLTNTVDRRARRRPGVRPHMWDRAVRGRPRRSPVEDRRRSRPRPTCRCGRAGRSSPDSDLAPCRWRSDPARRRLRRAHRLRVPQPPSRTCRHPVESKRVNAEDLPTPNTATTEGTPGSSGGGARQPRRGADTLHWRCGASPGTSAKRRTFSPMNAERRSPQTTGCSIAASMPTCCCPSNDLLAGPRA